MEHCFLVSKLHESACFDVIIQLKLMPTFFPNDIIKVKGLLWALIIMLCMIIGSSLVNYMHCYVVF